MFQLPLVAQWENMNTINLTGKPIDDGQTVVVDHYTQRFTVVIRSMSPIGEDTLKNIIQQKYEVVEIKQQDANAMITTTPNYKDKLD